MRINMAQVRVFPSSTAARWLSMFGVMLLVVLLALPGAHAAKTKAKTKKFDHDNTGFVLTGAHTDLACDTCHIRGIFKGIPKTCDGCHAQVSQITATKKNQTHIKSTNRCDDCHVDTAWKPVKVDHAAVFGVCNDCHYDNSTIASHKPDNHPSAGTDCQNCHRTSTWATSGFNHAGITNKCDSCHNGTTVKSKKPNDVVHSNVTNVANCENCHTSFVSWPPSRFDHSYISSNTCVNCHKPGVTPAHTSRPATTASGAAHPNDDNCYACHKNTASWNSADPHAGVTGGCNNCHSAKKPTDVVHANVTTVTVCENCHKSFTVWPPTTAFDHAYISSNKCVNCHNPSATPKHTSRPAMTAAGTAHPNDDACASCHTNTSSWSTASIDHVATGNTKNCISCHLNKKPTDTEHSNFLSATVCENCHKSFTTWPITTLDHTLVSTTRCVTCHSPGHKTITTRPVLKADGTTHPVDDNCENCHQSAGVKWTGAAGKPSNHDTLASGCVTCHLVDKSKSAKHMPTPNDNCETCHTPTSVKFSPWTWTHSTTVTTNCNQCHDGTVPHADGRSAKHISISGTSGCNLCHKNTSAWTVNAVDHTQTVGTCVSCHKPNNNPPVRTSKASDPRAGGHIVVSDDCTACHKNQNPGGWTTHIMDHNQLAGGNSSCASVGCHSTVKATVNHFPTTPSTAECGPTCHSPSLPDWSSAKYAHDGNTDCNSCHGRAKTYKGVVTELKDSKHMNDLQTKYSLQCSACHSGTTNFTGSIGYFSKHMTPVDFSGHSSVACLTCHTGGQAASSIGYKNTGAYKNCAGSVTCTACHKSSKYNKNDPSAHNGQDICTGNLNCANCHSFKDGKNINSK